MNSLVQTVDGLQEILGICPCCGEVFRLAEAKFMFPQRRPRSCEYLDLVALEIESSIRQERICAAEERFGERFEAQKEKLREMARIVARQRMKKIDPIFTGRNIDPQDVKAIFHPVEYVVFQGLCSDYGVERIRFVSRTPQTKSQDTLVRSVDKTIQRGDVDFEMLHLRDDGSFRVNSA